ncbi:uncharacterized protein LOC120322596 [Pipra filicauda]|uniref:Uncharacterized protein LOC120322596 n=1 Tax=Pipra filicauda TaxID=649802 RepID=A0A7R5K460_9PASS|nr:uncharacterized protein LOC120322596 [Pipra filicauda]
MAKFLCSYMSSFSQGLTLLRRQKKNIIGAEKLLFISPQPCPLSGLPRISSEKPGPSAEKLLREEAAPSLLRSGIGSSLYPSMKRGGIPARASRRQRESPFPLFSFPSRRVRESPFGFSRNPRAQQRPLPATTEQLQALLLQGSNSAPCWSWLELCRKAKNFFFGWEFGCRIVVCFLFFWCATYTHIWFNKGLLSFSFSTFLPLDPLNSDLQLLRGGSLVFLITHPP